MAVTDFRNKILTGNALDVLKTLPDNSVDMICTSPPYWGLRDYKTELTFFPGNGACEHAWEEQQKKDIQLQAGNPEFQRPWREEASSHDYEEYEEKHDDSSTLLKLQGRKGNTIGDPEGRYGIKERSKYEQHDWDVSAVGMQHENRNFQIGTQEAVHENPTGTTFIRKFDDPTKTHDFEEYEREKNTWGEPNSGNDGKLAIKDEQNFQFIDKKIFRFCKRCGAWWGQLGLEPTFQTYLVHLYQIFAEIRRVLKPTGTVWIVIGDTFYGGGQAQGHTMESTNFGLSTEGRDYVAKPVARGKNNNVRPKSLVGIPDRFKIGMIDQGWICRGDIIWHKPNVLPSSVKDRFTTDYERVLFFSKENDYYFEQQLELADADSLRESKRSSSVKKELENPEAIISTQRQSLKDNGLTNRIMRNKRTVWRIATKPYHEAHFATFPPDLIETPIKAGCPEWVCIRCGMPKIPKYKWLTDKEPLENYTGGALKEYEDALAQNPSDTKRRILESMTLTKIPDGFETCACNAGFQRGIVLDPFFGSGTTGLVAHNLGRDYIGIELNPAFVVMAKKRLAGLSKRLEEFL